MPIKMTEALVESLTLSSASGAGHNDIARITETIWSHRKA
jgi:hypothetical protein